jgi:predicted transcriptional regulator
LRGVPFFVKGSVKKKFPREPENWVLLDWKGTFAKTYELEENVCNIFLLNRDGRVVRRTGQTDVDPEIVSELSRTIQQLAACPAE